MDFIKNWPGKSAQDEGGIEHPAAYHMLDVAAVAEILIAPRGFSKPMEQALILLTALHDLGKIGEVFRRMLREGVVQSERHWQVTEVLLRRHEELLEPRLGGVKQRRFELYAAAAGHHGAPPTDLRRDAVSQRAGAAAIADSGAAVAAFLDLWPDSSLEALVDLEEAKRLSWWFSGFVSTADWIGSNRDWFLPVAPGPSVAEYLAYAREKAALAVEKAGLVGALPAEGWILDFTKLRSMQQACLDIALPEGPMLAVIEDETGAGKTEAALLLAQRMLLAKKGRGLFFALPTMATADAMFLRARNHVGRMFLNKPSLTLAHGRSGLSEAFRELVVGAENAPDDVGCASWLAEGRRRALLADVGVGTIDQVLLSALKVKFQTLRHFALSSKILIVDEVHEMGDPYMQEELIAVLKQHRAAGGSAILLSATLPLHLRNRLLATWEAPPDSNPAYPSLTIAGGAVRRDFMQEAGARGPIRVARLPDAESAAALLKRFSEEDGAACVWVRNSVDEAIAAVELLRASGVEAELLHARFALCDRKRIEAAMLKRFGKEGEGREGAVLVGTQVLESSLDLDFDVMISDLAPMASLIQRAGRLWRHMDKRPRAARPVPEPVLYVLSPDPAKVEDGAWLRRALGRGAAVYALDLQWRTADRLFGAGVIEAPAGLRGLIEAAHAESGEADALGRAATPLPEAVVAAELKRQAERSAHASHAKRNLVEWEAGFRLGARADDDAEYPTRLGEPQTRLTLARLEGGRLTPWAQGGEAGEGLTPWMLSEIAAASKKLEALAIPNPSIKPVDFAGWPKWRRETVRFCVVEEDGRICEGLRYEADLGLIFEAPLQRG